MTAPQPRATAARPRLTAKERREMAAGWWCCCRVYYAGFGWRNRKPPCPECADESKPRKATRGDVERAELERNEGWHGWSS